MTDRAAQKEAVVNAVLRVLPAETESLGDGGGRRYPALDGCVEDGAPGAACRHTECRYHLAHRGYWEHSHRPTHDCSIDVANEGPHTLDEVALFMGISGERVRQIEEEALEQLKHSATLKGLHDESPY